MGTLQGALRATQGADLMGIAVAAQMVDPLKLR